MCFLSRIESERDSTKEDQMLNIFSNEQLRSRFISENFIEEVFLDEKMKIEILKLVNNTENLGVLNRKKLDSNLRMLLKHIKQEELIILFSEGNQRKIRYVRGAPKPTFGIPIAYFCTGSSIFTLNLYFYNNLSENFVSEVVPAFHRLRYMHLNLNTGKVEKLYSQTFSRSPLTKRPWTKDSKR